MPFSCPSCDPRPCLDSASFPFPCLCLPRHSCRLHPAGTSSSLPSNLQQVVRTCKLTGDVILISVEWSQLFDMLALRTTSINPTVPRKEPSIFRQQKARPLAGCVHLPLAPLVTMPACPASSGPLAPQNPLTARWGGGRERA